jgi:amino acid transporter
MAPKPTLIQRSRTLLVGAARDLYDPTVFHKISLVAFFAWVGLGSDGISSSCYGPEEAFLALGEHHYLAIFVALGAALTILVISASYSQIIDLFPTGGGGYLVASKLLSPPLGMLSGCALLIDYVLTITLSVASGADAIFSFLPQSLYSFRLGFAVLGVVILTLLNLRGVKESVVPLVPIFLAFIITHATAIIYGLSHNLANLPRVVQATVTEVQQVQYQVGFLGMFFLIMRAYSMGAGTFTGIEAVSNGIPILREPKVQTAKRTMRYMAGSLTFMVTGLMLAYLLYRVELEPGKTLNAVLFQRMASGWGTSGYLFVLLTLVSEAVLLFVAAQTGFLDGPRVLANMALDRWFPNRFAVLSERLVTQNGILVMGCSAAALMLLTGGSVRFLVVLYSINVFITFALSQLGMVRHWWKSRFNLRGWQRKLLVNGVGLVLSSFILFSVVVLKFHQGGWITLFVTGGLVGVAIVIHRQYARDGQLLRRLDSLLPAASVSTSDSLSSVKRESEAIPKFDPEAKTAVLLVGGFNGLGLHTLFDINRLFGETYKNFVFVQVGTVDAGTFKGSSEVESLENHIKSELGHYTDFVRRRGYYAEAIYSIGTEVVDEVVKLAPKILKRYPNAVFFGGQLVFKKDSLLSRWLHNYTAFAVQRRLYRDGIPVLILPIRV